MVSSSRSCQTRPDIAALAFTPERRRVPLGSRGPFLSRPGGRLAACPEEGEHRRRHSTKPQPGRRPMAALLAAADSWRSGRSIGQEGCVPAAGRLLPDGGCCACQKAGSDATAVAVTTRFNSSPLSPPPHLLYFVLRLGAGMILAGASLAPPSHAVRLRVPTLTLLSSLKPM